MSVTTDISSVERTREMLEKLNLNLNSGYISSATIKAIIIGLLCVACFILAVVFIKKSRGLGITTVIMQFLGIFAASRYVIAFSKIDWSKFVVVEYGSSYEEATNKAMNSLMESYMEAIPTMAASSLWNMLMLAATIISLIYIAKVMKIGNKALGIPALILTILRFVLSPLQFTSLFTDGKLTVAAQQSWDGFYAFVYLLPALLIGVMAILYFVKSKKAAAAVEATEAAPAAKEKTTTENK